MMASNYSNFRILVTLLMLHVDYYSSILLTSINDADLYIYGYSNDNNYVAAGSQRERATCSCTCTSYL